MKKIISAIGIIIIIYMLCLFINVNYNTGILIGLLIGIFMSFWAVLPINFFFKFLKCLFILVLCFFICMSSIIAFNGMCNKADFTEDALIVLGCGLNGSELSKNLKDRLDTAIEYYNNNNDAIIIVSGGQGPQEDIPEAEAMYKYLVENGVNAEIIKESKSSSTNENFKFSKEILDKKFGSDYKVAYITNDFHIYRAGKLAELNNLYAAGYAAPTEIFSIIPNYLRESLAVIQLWFFGR